MGDVIELKFMRELIVKELYKRLKGSGGGKTRIDIKKIIPHLDDTTLYRKLAALNNTIKSFEEPIFLLKPTFSTITDPKKYTQILYRYKATNLEADVFIEQLQIFCRAMDNTTNNHLQAFIFKFLMSLVKANNHNLDPHRRKVLQDMVKEYPNNTYKPYFSWIMPVAECHRCGKRGKWFISNSDTQVFCSMKHLNQKSKKMKFSPK